MASKKSKMVQYGGSNNKTKMLVEALNLNSTDTLHNTISVNHRNGEAYDGDVNIIRDYYLYVSSYYVQTDS